MSNNYFFTFHVFMRPLANMTIEMFNVLPWLWISFPYIHETRSGQRARTSTERLDIK